MIVTKIGSSTELGQIATTLREHVEEDTPLQVRLKSFSKILTYIVIGFTLVFWISYLCWLLGHFAYIAATKNDLAKFGIGWSASMTGEFGFIIALIAGLIVGNFFPRLADLMKEAARPDLYIKTAIVIMGAGLGLKAAQSFGLATNIMFRGFCAIVEAYLIYWAVVYYIARKYFNIGCTLLRHGQRHDLYVNPKTGKKQPLPRNNEIDENLARHIIRILS